MLFPKGKGELIDEETLLARIMAVGIARKDRLRRRSSKLAKNTLRRQLSGEE